MLPRSRAAELKMLCIIAIGIMSNLSNSGARVTEVIVIALKGRVADLSSQGMNTRISTEN
jgi:hypothetical protein